MQIELTQSLRIVFLLLLSACGSGNVTPNDSGTGQVQNIPDITTQPANLHATIGSPAGQPHQKSFTIKGLKKVL